MKKNDMYQNIVLELSNGEQIIATIPYVLKEDDNIEIVSAKFGPPRTMDPFKIYLMGRIGRINPDGTYWENE